MHLRNPYISVLMNNTPTYGGDQRQCANKVIAKCGCGIIAALDTLLYLNLYQKDIEIPEFDFSKQEYPLQQLQYEQLLDQLHKHYFPLFYPLGMNGLTLSIGMNLFFKRHGISLKAHWGVPYHRLWASVESMLSQDIPVIMSVGPNFPKVWRRDKAIFHRDSGNGSYSLAAYARAHYVTATGLDNEWIEISSWGNKYYMNRNEFQRYAKECSINLLCNILYITRTAFPGK